MRNVHAFLCFSPSIKVINVLDQCMPSNLYHWQAERGWTVIQMVLMKTKKHSISGLQKDSVFSSCGLGRIVLVVSDSGFSASSQLNWRLTPEKLGLCWVVCISPLLKRERTVPSTELNSASLEKKKREPVQPIREHSMLCALLTMGLRVPFSLIRKNKVVFL